MSISIYGSTTTTIGDAALLEAATAGAGITLTHMLIGDGNGEFVATETLAGRTSLVRQVHRMPITNMYDDPSTPNQKIVEAILPIDVGGFTIRELGLEDVSGRLIAAGNFPATHKTTFAEGCTRDMLFRFAIATSHAAQLTIVINPSTVFVTHVEHGGLHIHPWAYFIGQL